MKRYAQYLSKFGHVRSFDYPYMMAGKKRPDPPQVLIEAHRSELLSAKKQWGPHVVLAGKSMGGRIGCHLALEEEVLGVLCFGYPLNGMGKSGALRDQVLFDLKVPACFVQGTRDTLCPLDLMKATLERRQGRSVLHVVESGDHSLVPTRTYLKETGITQEEQETETMLAVEKFLASL